MSEKRMTPFEMMLRVAMWYRRYTDALAELGGTPLAQDIEALALIESASVKHSGEQPAPPKPTAPREWVENFVNDIWVSESDDGVRRVITKRLRDLGITIEEEKCLTCDGKGIVYSDPDRRQLVCGDCQGKGK